MYCFLDRCLSFFFWPLCCLSFFDLRIMITSLWYPLTTTIKNLIKCQYYFNCDIIIYIRLVHSIYIYCCVRPLQHLWGRRGRDRMVVGFTTTCAISTYHNYSCEFEARTWQSVLDTTLCDKVCQWLAGGWFSPGTPVPLYVVLFIRFVCDINNLSFAL